MHHNNILKIAAIADLHFGAMNSKMLLEELTMGFLKKIEDEDSLDMVVICGDLFDHKLSLNSLHSKLCFKFLLALCILAKKQNFAVRILKGTLSHDNDQLDNLVMFKDICDFKIFNSVDSEIFKGNNILYIPEEYPDNHEEYYKDAFNDNYDFIFGHGMVEEVSFNSKKDAENHIAINKSPIFNTKKLLSICDGVCVFGHIHIHQIIKKRFYYCGSFSRWRFGEEERKGFQMIMYDKNNPSMSHVKFIENTMASIYDTINMDVHTSSFENVSEMIKNILDSTISDKKRIIINLHDDVENPKFISSMITEMFGKIENVKLIVNDFSKEIARVMQDQEVTKMLDEYGFIFDKDIEIEEKIRIFINKKYGKNIPVDRIKLHIHNTKNQL